MWWDGSASLRRVVATMLRGSSDGALQVVDVWDSEQDFQRFAEG